MYRSRTGRHFQTQSLSDIFLSLDVIIAAKFQKGAYSKVYMQHVLETRLIIKYELGNFYMVYFYLFH